MSKRKTVQKIEAYTGFDPHPGQMAIYDCPARFRVVSCGRRFGKALALDTPMPTPCGWTTMGEVRVGQQVFDERGQPTVVTYVSPIMYNRPCYEVQFSDGNTVVADAGHRWLTYSKAARKHEGRAKGREHRRSSTEPSVVTTEEISKTLRVGLKRESNHAVQLAEPLQYEAVEQPIDPYVLGVWLGDGTSASGSIATDDPEIVQYIRDAGFPAKKGKEPFMWSISEGAQNGKAKLNSLQARLARLGLLKNKHIPEAYLHGSVEQRIALLMGLMDTDGTASKEGACFFDNTNLRLAEGVYELAVSLGLKPYWSEKRAKLKGKDCGPYYEVYFTPHIPVFRLPRKLERQKPQVKACQRFRFIRDVKPVESVPVRCIAVDAPSHLFLASRACIPTHNTELAKLELAIPAAEGYPVAYFAPDYKRTTEVWRDMKTMLAAATTDKSETEYRLELVTGGVIEFWTLADERAGASRKYKKVVFDEAAHSPNLEEVWLSAVRPTLMDMGGSALFLSTPKGHNFFWQLFRLGEDPLEPEWKEFKMPTSANPFIDPAEIEAAKRNTPELKFQEEYLAEFISDSGAVFRHIRDAATAEAQTQAAEGHQYFVGVDTAKSQDFSVFSVFDVTLNSLVHIDRHNHVDYTLQLVRLKTLCEVFRPLGVVIEKNSAVAFVELCEKANLPVIPFQTSLASKMLIVEHLAAAFDRPGGIYILPDRVLIGELEAFEMERLASGMFRYNAPRGLHDDTVISLALAFWGATYNVTTWQMELV